MRKNWPHLHFRSCQVSWLMKFQTIFFPSKILKNFATRWQAPPPRLAAEMFTFEEKKFCRPGWSWSCFLRSAIPPLQFLPSSQLLLSLLVPLIVFSLSPSLSLSLSHTHTLTLTHFLSSTHSLSASNFTKSNPLLFHLPLLHHNKLFCFLFLNFGQYSSNFCLTLVFYTLLSKVKKCLWVRVIKLMLLWFITK